MTLKDLKVLLERMVKWDLLEGEIGACGEEGVKGDTSSVSQQGPIGPQGSTGPRRVQVQEVYEVLKG